MSVICNRCQAYLSNSPRVSTVLRSNRLFYNRLLLWRGVCWSKSHRDPLSRRFGLRGDILHTTRYDQSGFTLAAVCSYTLCHKHIVQLIHVPAHHQGRWSLPLLGGLPLSLHLTLPLTLPLTLTLTLTLLVLVYREVCALQQRAGSSGALDSISLLCLQWLLQVPQAARKRYCQHVALKKQQVSDKAVKASIMTGAYQ